MARDAGDAGIGRHHAALAVEHQHGVAALFEQRSPQLPGRGLGVDTGPVLGNAGEAEEIAALGTGKQVMPIADAADLGLAAAALAAPHPLHQRREGDCRWSG